MSVNVKQKRKMIGKKVIRVEGIESPIELILLGKPLEADGGFVKFFIAFSERLALDEKLSGKAIRLIHWIAAKRLVLGHTHFGFTISEVAKDLNVSEDTVRRWRRILIRESIIIQLGRDWYKINPEYLYRGRAWKAQNINVQNQKEVSYEQ